jgi:protein ImuA
MEQPMSSKASTLEALKQRIASFETRPALSDAESGRAEGFLGTPRGYVHEVFADSVTNTGAAFGFAMAQARSLLSAERPGLLIVQLKSDAQELGLPYGLGFRSFGLEATAFVLIRTDTIVELLWALEEAIACRAVGAIVADIAYPHKALDFTASRRLAMRTAASGAALFLVRYARDREATAARYRWRVEPQLSGPMPFDERAPGPPRWRLTLEKGRLAGRRAGPQGEQYLVDLTENGLVQADIGSSRDDGARAPAVAALSHAAPASLGDRLPQAG